MHSTHKIQAKCSHVQYSSREMYWVMQSYMRRIKIWHCIWCTKIMQITAVMHLS